MVTQLVGENDLWCFLKRQTVSIKGTWHQLSEKVHVKASSSKTSQRPCKEKKEKKKKHDCFTVLLCLVQRRFKQKSLSSYLFKNVEAFKSTTSRCHYGAMQIKDTWSKHVAFNQILLGGINPIPP